MMIMTLMVMIIITMMMTSRHSSNGGCHPSRCIFAVFLCSFLLRKEGEIFCYFSVSISERVNAIVPSGLLGCRPFFLRYPALLVLLTS